MWLLAILTLVTAPAETSPSQDEAALIEAAKSACRRGESLAVGLQTAKAAAAFEEGIELFSRAYFSLPSMRDVARCWFQLGVTWTNAAKHAAATEAFGRAVVFDDSIKPNARKHSPRVVQSFAAAKRVVERSKRGGVTVVGTPFGAEVVIDGRASGNLPVSVPNLVVGEHWIGVRAVGHQAFFARFTVQSSQIAQVSVYLQDLRPPAERVVATPRSLPSDASETGVLAASQPASSTSQPIVIDLPSTYPQTARRGVHPALAILPLGIGQFLEKRPVAGSLLLVSQLALLATNIALFWVANSERQPDGTYLDAARIQAMQISTNVAFGLLIADVIAGGIDGFVYRNYDASSSR